MTYHVNQFGRVVLTASNSTIPVEWKDGPVYLDPDSDYSRDFAKWVSEGNSPTAYAPSKEEANAPILRQLQANEQKAIRALLEGDAARIADWRAKQAALRARLV